MKRRILSMLCVIAILMGMVTVPAFAADAAATNGSDSYDSLQEAVDDYVSGVIRLTEDAADITVTADTYIDLNGHDVAGVTVTGGTLYCLDSQTDDYTVADGVYGKVTDISGSVAAVSEEADCADHGYLMVTGDDGVSFHCVNLQIYAMSLRPANAGVYYSSYFAGDELAAQSIQSFGVALSIVGEPTADNLTTKCAYSEFTGFLSGEGSNSASNTGTLLTGVMKETNTDAINARNAGIPVYGRAYAKTADGYLFGACVSRDLQTQIEAIDDAWTSLQSSQKSTMLAMYGTYESVMSAWDVPNMAAAYANPDQEPEDDSVIEVPIAVATENGVVTETVTVEENGVSVTVPAGTLLADGATELKLIVTTKETTDSGLTLEDNQVLLPVDVHVEGISSENTVPLTICLGKVLPENLNLGNYSAYHVENGSANEMTLIPADEAFTAHNQYKYTLDGELTLYMAAFSEVALVSNTENPWNGDVDTSWYNTTDTTFTIRNADQLAGLSKIVSGDYDEDGNALTADTFAGKTVKLLSDIDFTGNVWYPIGYWKQGTGTNTAGETEWYQYGGGFEGAFDGNGNTISNIHQNTWEMNGSYDNGYWNAAMGLFGYISGGSVKNLTIDGFTSEGEFAPTGCVTAYADGAVTFENISLINCHPQTYNTGVAGIVGWDNGGDTEEEASSFTYNNITIDSTNTVSALWGSWDVAAAGLQGYLGEYSTANLDNCHVSATIDVYNDVCGNYQYYWYRYCGMLIGTVDKTDADGNLDLSNITATGCTVNFGDRHEYYYCEFVANSLASYTHDHQFSRVSHDELNMDASLVTCNHDHAAAGYEETDIDGDGNIDSDVLKEDKQAVYIPFRQLFGGYGWGVKGTDITGYPDIEITDQAESVVKFTALINGAAYEETTDPVVLTVGDIFGASGNASIVSNQVQVFVSPADDTSDVSAVYAANTSDWTKGTLTFSGTGAAKIVITDYDYCIETVTSITITKRQNVQKFTPNEDYKVIAGATVTLGDLFTATVDDAQIDSANMKVTVNQEEYDYSAQTVESWSDIVLPFEEEGKSYTVVITDQDYCVDATTTVIAQTTDSFTHAETLKNINAYLYRVGNKSAIKLSSLFAELEVATINGDISVTAVSLLDNSTVVSGSYDKTAWESGTIDFADTFTGPAEVTVDALGANAYSLKLEVVDAKNVVTYSELTNTNSVFLNDITMSSGGSYYLSGATLYGNGFTFDVTEGAYSGTNLSSNYLISLSNASLDNVKIVGAVYTTYGATVKENYNRAVVLSTGNSTIANSYISNCAAPVRVNGGNLEIINTTLKGGNFANLDIRNGNVILENVTTVNQSNGNDKGANNESVVGLGVVIYYENVLSTTTVEIKGTLKQYNNISDNDTFSSTYAQELVKEMLGANHTSLQLEKDGVTWANAGIVSMTEGMSGNIIDSRTDKAGYVGETASLQGVDGYVYTTVPTETSIVEIPSAYETVGQYAVAPSYSFDYTTKNYAAKTDGSNDYCYEENGVVYISMDAGDSFSWDTSILTAAKNGQALSYTVSMNGTDYTGKSIGFSESGVYNVVYTYTDSNNYGEDAQGNITTYDKTYSKTVRISVAVIEASAKNAEFTFGSSNAATEKITVDNVTYVSATGVTADNSTWTYMTVGDKNIYYPIVAAKLTATKGSSSYAYFPVFENVVTITDYADSGTGDAFIYNASTTTLPSALTAVKGVYKAGDASAFTGLTNSSLTQSGASKIFKWASSSDAESTPTTYQSVLCYKSPQISANRDAYITLVQYSYTDATNTTYYYYVGYTLEVFTKQNSCVTPDTLVTLADGTQKEIQYVTYEDQLVVWDFVNGTYTTAASSIVKNHGYGQHDIVALTFDDGTVVKTINGHGFFDVEANEFVILNGSNAAEYVGHAFIKQDGAGNRTVKLVSYETYTEYTESWSVLTAEHYNCILEGMLTLTPAEVEGSPDYLMPFQVGSDLKYDEEAMQADIEKYGLYTYEEFAELLTYEQFVALNLKYFKVSVGKGYITCEQILFLIDLHM